MILNLLSFIIMMLMIMVGVAYMTILERKLLGYIQYRKGPNKSGFLGLLQPFSDAMKLIFKEIVYLNKSNIMLFYLSPIILLVIMIILWVVYPFFYGFIFLEYGILYILCCLSVSSYSILMSGWSSNSSYSFLGAIRSVAQIISYEVSLFIFFFNLMLFTKSYSLFDLYNYQNIVCMFLLSHFYLFIMVLISVLAELNRVPFDLIEGESELVSGFNTEYFGMEFALIFLAEYGMIMFMSFMIIMMFLGFNPISFKFMFFFMILNFFIVWIRGVLPRIRFDQLMMLCWKYFLPYSLMFLMFNSLFNMFM
uniref:NADH-ubiquinone oxidoreductase chain 1 n=1 Tax=Ammophila sabulosa TaxID=1088610 RepID=A0A7L7S3U6_9HYME|nr:NADH dehydrogenase subunit 1 [Ammophila sabulosa]